MRANAFDDYEEAVQFGESTKKPFKMLVFKHYSKDEWWYIVSETPLLNDYYIPSNQHQPNIRYHIPTKNGYVSLRAE